MKKIFTVLIVFTLAFSITGCSKNNDKTVQEESSPVYLDASVPSAPEMASPSPATDADGSSLWRTGSTTLTATECPKCPGW